MIGIHIMYVTQHEGGVGGASKGGGGAFTLTPSTLQVGARQNSSV